jgi:hypothetical protein
MRAHLLLAMLSIAGSALLAFAPIACGSASCEDLHDCDDPPSTTPPTAEQDAAADAATPSQCAPAGRSIVAAARRSPSPVELR